MRSANSRSLTTVHGTAETFVTTLQNFKGQMQRKMSVEGLHNHLQMWKPFPRSRQKPMHLMHYTCMLLDGTWQLPHSTAIQQEDLISARLLHNTSRGSWNTQKRPV